MNKGGSRSKEVRNISNILVGLVGCCKMDLLLINWETIEHFLAE